jgi:DNA-directed RNA polymerase sigma subunit (sigma70/sigma32)
MSPLEVSDYQLIEQIKKDKDNNALLELVNRHTGIYVDVISNYTFVPNITREDLIESKYTNIYKYALDFNPELKTKFSSYVGLRARYECQSCLTERKRIKEEEVITENTVSVDTHVEETEDLIRYIWERVEQNSDKRFIEIFKMRHSTDKPESFYLIGDRLGLSHEGAIKIYRKNLLKLKKELYHEFNYEKD